MQPLEIKTVEPYKIGLFPDEEFRHHFVWKGRTYMSGDKYMTLAEYQGDFPEIPEMWDRLDTHLARTVDEIMERARQVEEEGKTLKIKFGKDGEQVKKLLASDPRNTTAYMKMLRVHAHEALINTEQSALMASIRLGHTLSASLVMLLQAELRTRLPLRMVEMADKYGNRSAVAFVWHCPKNKQGEDDPSLCDPNALRDFGQTVLGLLGEQEFKRLWEKFGPKETTKPSLIRKYSEEDLKRAEGNGRLRKL